MTSHSVTVGIPHHADGKILPTLLSIERQTLPPLEIIIATDLPRPLSLPNLSVPVRQLINLVNNVSLKRNICADNARGDLIAFTDPDCIPNLDWLANAVGYFQDEHTVGVEGFGYSERVPGNLVPASITPGLYGTANMIYRTEIVKKERFDTAFGSKPSCEDIEFGWRAKKYGIIAWAPNAGVYHEPKFWGTSKTIKEYIARKSAHVLLYKKVGKAPFGTTLSPGANGNLLYVIALIYGSFHYRSAPPLWFAVNIISARTMISNIKLLLQSTRFASRR